jgi:hypothetical protein
LARKALIQPTSIPPGARGALDRRGYQCAGLSASTQLLPGFYPVPERSRRRSCCLRSLSGLHHRSGAANGATCLPVFCIWPVPWISSTKPVSAASSVPRFQSPSFPQPTSS